MSKVIGAAIKSDRDRLGISQSLLARTLRISQQILSRWESGDAAPKGVKLNALLTTLGSASETRQLVLQIQNIDPTFFDSTDQHVVLTQAPLAEPAEAARIQFEKAVDQLTRATNLLGKVAALMADSGAILALAGQKLSATEQKDASNH